jgi:ribosome-associated protein
MPGMLVIQSGIAIPAAELHWRFSRSSGPGGQGVNTADSRVELSWNLAETTALPEALKARALDRLAGRLVDGVITIAASEHRAQLRNRTAAEARLAALLREAIAAPPRARRATKPTKGSVERRIAAKKRRSNIKQNRRGDEY